jgi:hypothetical protein
MARDEASAAADEPENNADNDNMPDSPANASRNYVIPFTDLLIEKEIGKGAYGKVYKAKYQNREVKTTHTHTHTKKNKQNFTHPCCFFHCL